jgi:hypothetical protein
MIRGHSDLVGGPVEAEGEPGIHTYLTVCVAPGGKQHVTAWLTLDGAYEAESEGEREGMTCEVIEADA